MPINKEVNAQFIFPQNEDRLFGIQIENSGLSLPELTEIAFFALDFGYKLCITDRSGTFNIHSPGALKNRLNNPDHHDWRGKVIEDMKKGKVITLADPSWQPSLTKPSF